MIYMEVDGLDQEPPGIDGEKEASGFLLTLRIMTIKNMF